MHSLSSECASCSCEIRYQDLQLSACNFQNREEHGDEASIALYTFMPYLHVQTLLERTT